MPKKIETKLPFKPRARLLLLLGDQLIRSPSIAVFELVKNSYDADSKDVEITFENLDETLEARIVVEDTGTGMDFKTVTQEWLEPGTDYRAGQRKSLKRTTVFSRMPLGEKGVGRFAAHKLGNNIRLITRKGTGDEILIEIDWSEFSELNSTKKLYLADIPVKITRRTPEHFVKKKTGTRIEITQLKDNWTRGGIRNLARSINSITSPFSAKGEFQTKLNIIGHEDWLSGLLKVEDVLDYSLYHALCVLEDKKLELEYKFTPYSRMEKVESRSQNYKGKKSLSLPKNLENHAIGKVKLEMYIFDREPRVLSLGVSDRKGLQDFLDNQGGVRVYRDGIRVYDYGEPDNDWLGLGGRRVNVPTKRISNNIILSAIAIDRVQSQDLIEKTNREGFVENEAFNTFKECIKYTIKQIEAERNKDKLRIRNAYASQKVKEPVLEDLSEIREIVRKKKLENELDPYLDRIESDFLTIRDRFLVSASSGLSLAVVIHEVEKGIAELSKAVIADHASERLVQLAAHLSELVEGFAALIKQSGSKKEKASELIHSALFNVSLRLEHHGITMVQETNKYDFSTVCSRRLVISTIMNLIDNSIWWLHNKWGTTANVKKLFVGTSNEFPSGPAIIVADNGPGFIDPPEYLIEPFISRKPDGMGLGLHLADQVMKAQGGELRFPGPGDVTLPRDFGGAVVALIFKRD